MSTSTRQFLTLLLRFTTPILFVVLFLFFGTQSSRFLEGENIVNIIKQASFIGIVSVGMTFVLLTGGIDLTVGATMYLAPLIAGVAMRQFGIGVLPALLIALVVGAIIGMINGFFIVRARIIPFIVTLSMLFFIRGAGTFLTASRQLDFPRSIVDFGLTNVFGVIPLPIIIFAIAVIIAHIVLTQTAFGRQLYAVGNDIEAAKKAGINTDRIVFSVYVISGVCAALGGFILIAQIGRLDQAFGEGREFDVIAATVLGGTSLFGGVGNAFGAVVGSTLIQMVEAGLIFANVNLYLQPMVQGLIIFLAVFFDSLRETNLRRLKRRFIRAEA
jgi:ribose/xylose/arabinose/galactoside ABC-type transport system permease subunit